MDRANSLKNAFIPHDLTLKIIVLIERITDL